MKKPKLHAGPGFKNMNDRCCLLSTLACLHWGLQFSDGFRPSLSLLRRNPESKGNVPLPRTQSAMGRIGKDSGKGGKTWQGCMNSEVIGAQRGAREKEKKIRGCN